MNIKAAHWVPIWGTCEITDGVIKYVPTVVKEGANQGKRNTASLSLISTLQVEAFAFALALKMQKARRNSA